MLVPLKPIAIFLMKIEIDVCPNSKRETLDNNLLAFIAARLMWKHSPKRTKRLSSLKYKTFLIFVKVCQIIEKKCHVFLYKSEATFLRLLIIIDRQYKKKHKNYLAGNKAFCLSSQTDDSHFANIFLIKILVTYIKTDTL